MTFRISGKNMDLGDTLRSEISARIDEAVEKYFGRTYTGHVTITKDPNGFSTECMVHLASGMVLASSGEAHEARQSFEKAADKLEKRLRRYKRKLRDHNQRDKRADALAAANYILAAPSEDEEVPEDFNPVIIAETASDVPSLSVGNAVMEMDLSDSELLVFRNAGHGGINVVYRRPDGNIGWVDPSLQS